MKTFLRINLFTKPTGHVLDKDSHHVAHIYTLEKEVTWESQLGMKLSMGERPYIVRDIKLSVTMGFIADTPLVGNDESSYRVIFTEPIPWSIMPKGNVLYQDLIHNLDYKKIREEYSKNPTDHYVTDSDIEKWRKQGWSVWLPAF